MEKKPYTVQEKYFPKNQIPQRYHVIKVIGKGSYGCVALALDKQSNCKVALKKIENLFVDLIDAKRVLREVIVLKNAVHKCLVKLIDIFAYPPNKFQTIFIVTSYQESDLKRLLDKNVSLNLSHIQSISYQILVGLQYLHSRCLVHRDIKPANILINRESLIKICDFGLSRSVKGVAKPWYENVQIQQKIDQYENIKNVKEETKAAQQFPIKQEQNENDETFFDNKTKIEVPKVEVKKQAQQSKKKKPTIKKTATNLKSQEQIKGSPFNQSNTSHILKSVISFNVVTRWYRSPQIILMQNYTSSVDLWSFGCVFAQLLRNVNKANKQPLFQGKSCFPLQPDNSYDKVVQVQKTTKYIISQNDQLNKIFDIIGTPTAQQLGWISQKGVVEYVMKSFQTKQPKNLYQVFGVSNKDQSLKLAVDFLKGFIAFDPRERIKLKDALKHPFLDGVTRVPELEEVVEQPVQMSFEQEENLTREKLLNLFQHQIKDWQNSVKLNKV